MNTNNLLFKEMGNALGFKEFEQVTPVMTEHGVLFYNSEGEIWTANGDKIISDYKINHDNLKDFKDGI